MATGCLSASRMPDYPGIDSFQGPWYHTGHWPHEGVDFTGQRVAVIGTGSSGIQSIPLIAEQADHLWVFQRTPNFSLPANNAYLTPERVSEYRENFAEIKAQARASISGVPIKRSERSALETPAEERAEAFEAGWQRGGFHMIQAFNDLVAGIDANETAAEFVRTKIREIVHDPEIAETLSPRDYPLGTKRICIDTDYFATYNRDNVTLINIRTSPIVEITLRGVRTEDAEYEVDSIVFATGFDAMTGALLSIDIQGRDGLRLAEKWAAGPRTYLGLQVAGFPNFFTITGPGSPSVLSNMIVSIEQHVDWIAECMTHLRERGIASMDELITILVMGREQALANHVVEAL
jgi:cyclohexanone monooxygenase